MTATLTERVAVRDATPEDIPWMLGQVQQFATFYGSRHSLYPGDEQATAKLNDLMENQTLAIACRGDERLGLMAAVLTESFWNPRISQFAQVLWWVAPEHRGTRAGAALLSWFDGYSQGVGAEMTSVTLEAHSPEGVGEALERRGFRLHELTYLREGDPPASYVVEEFR